MAWENTVYIDITADIKNFEKKLNESIKVARDTWKKLDSELIVKMDLNIAEMQLKLQNAKNIMKKAKADWDETMQIKANIDINNLSRNLTEAKRQMNNYLNTWETNLSRLQAKFNEVNKNIEKQGGLLWWLKDKFGDFIKWWAVLAWITALAIKTDEFEKASKKLENQLWLTSSEAKIFRDVLTDLDNLGFLTIEENTKIVSTLRKELWLTNVEIKEVWTWIWAISKTFEKDFNEVLRANTALQKNFWISWQEANDIITRSLQNTGDTYDDLLDSINEYSAKAKDSWIEVWRFINILIDWTKKWIRNTDELADAQREMAIRLQDWSKSSIEALGRLWINYNDLKNDIKKGNITVWEAMQMVAQKIEWIEDPLDRVQIWTALMWTKFEDNWNIIIDVMANASSSIDWVDWATATMVENSQTWLDKIKSSFKELWNVWAETGGSLFTDLTNAFANILTYFVSFLKNTIFWIKTFWKAFWIALFWIWETFYETFRVTQNILKTFIGNWIQFFGNFWKNIQILANNIPAYFWLALDKTTKYLNKWSNSAISVINNIWEKLWIWAIKWVDITTNFWWNVQDFIWDFKPIELDFDLKNTKKLMEKLWEDITNDLNKLTWNIQSASWVKKIWWVTTSWVTTDLKPTTTKPTWWSWKSTAQKQIEDEEKKELERIEKNEKYKKDLRIKNQNKATEIIKEDLEKIKISYDKSKDIFIENSKKMADSIKDITDEVENLTEANKKLDEAQAENEKNITTNLSDRFLEITKREEEIKKELLDTENKIKLEEELNKLQKEKALINQNVDSKVLDEAQRFDNLSPTEKYLEEFNVEKNRIELLKKANEEKIAELESQKQKESLILESYKLKEAESDKLYADTKNALEEIITNKLKLEADKRIEILNWIRLEALATAEALRNAWLNLNTDITGSWVNTAWIWSANWSSSNTTNTATTVVNNTFNQNINSAVDVNKVNKIVLDSMSANAKGMSSLKV